MRPSQVIAALSVCIDKKRPAFIWGAPGIGKSDMIAKLARDNEMELRDVRLNMMDPTDIKGFPVPDLVNQQMHWLPASFLPPMLVEQKVKGKTVMVPNPSRGILFLDELNQAPPATQAVSYQLLLNRAVGDYKLPDGWVMLAAGNRTTDRANAQQMPTALASRLVHFDMEVNVDDWCDWALDQGDKIPVELISFIRFRPDLLHDFNKDARSSPCPRSWAFVGELTHSGLDPAIEFKMFEGTVGAGPAGEYLAYLSTCRELPTVDQVKLDPDGTPIPNQPNTMFAITAALARATTKDSYPKLMQYVKRMDAEWQVTYNKDVRKTCPDAEHTKEFIKWAVNHSHLL